MTNLYDLVVLAKSKVSISSNLSLSLHEEEIDKIKHVI